MHVCLCTHIYGNEHKNIDYIAYLHMKYCTVQKHWFIYSTDCQSDINSVSKTED